MIDWFRHNLFDRTFDDRRRCFRSRLDFVGTGFEILFFLIIFGGLEAKEGRQQAVGNLAAQGLIVADGLVIFLTTFLNPDFQGFHAVHEGLIGLIRLQIRIGRCQGLEIGVLTRHVRQARLRECIAFALAELLGNDVQVIERRFPLGLIRRNIGQSLADGLASAARVL